VEDNGGQILADDVIAADVADELARRVYEVRPELRNKGYAILVTDDEGREVRRLKEARRLDRTDLTMRDDCFGSLLLLAIVTVRLLLLLGTLRLGPTESPLTALAHHSIVFSGKEPSDFH